MEYLEDTFDTGQHEDGLYKFKSIKDHRGPDTSSNILEEVTIYLLNGRLGR